MIWTKSDENDEPIVRVSHHHECIMRVESDNWEVHDICIPDDKPLDKIVIILTRIKKEADQYCT